MSMNNKEEKKADFDAPVQSFKNKILVFLNKEKRPLMKRELLAKCKTKNDKEKKAFEAAMQELKTEGFIFEKRKGFTLCSRLGYFKGTIKRLRRTFGFAERDDDGTEIFIPGKFLLGAMPEDKVLLHLIPSRSGSPEGEVVSILETGTQQLTGKVEYWEGTPYLVPDTMSKSHIRIVGDENAFSEGDKVLAKLVFRGERHADHKVEVLYNFGDSDIAKSCTESILYTNGIETEFPSAARLEAEKISFAGINEYDFNNRLDLRGECIFTIDGADTKDIDDAVSVSRNSDGSYNLGVHIADVSHYVKGNSELDKDAYNRGTSIYYGNTVIPMLPKELSNGICSLNPREDRLAFSCLMKISPDGELKSYEFKKTVICSRVKGVYSEINSILDGSATEEIKEKYAEEQDTIFLMQELADKLTAQKIKRGAPQIETNEAKLVIDENGVCTGIYSRERGKGEVIIEEFMLMANTSAGKLAKEKGIPFVYRVHETPALEKIDTLKETLIRLNIKYPPFTDVTPKHLADILESVKGETVYPIVNMMVLRSMAKAKYASEPLGHFGLALADYCHFTSPIRRYPDLAIHRILTDVVAGYDKNWLTKRYEKFAENASEQSSNAEIKAMMIERDCEDCYKAEYMSNHVGEEFDGIISGISDYGFYVELPNSVEGLVHINTMPDEIFQNDMNIILKGQLSNMRFTVGDMVRVKCIKANVNDGNIDFMLAED